MPPGVNPGPIPSTACLEAARTPWRACTRQERHAAHCWTKPLSQSCGGIAGASLRKGPLSEQVSRSPLMRWAEAVKLMQLLNLLNSNPTVCTSCSSVHFENPLDPLHLHFWSLVYIQAWRRLGPNPQRPQRSNSQLQIEAIQMHKHPWSTIIYWTEGKLCVGQTLGQRMCVCVCQTDNGHVTFVCVCAMFDDQ